jgi:5-hydroxyisourate hydrolase
MRTNGMTIALSAPWASANGEALETHHEGAHGGLMGTLTTHVLDTSRGRPGAGVRVELYRVDGKTPALLSKAVTNRDGRTDKPLADGDGFVAGTYQIVFYMGEYFSSGTGAAGGAASFVDVVPVRFHIADAGQHYHVPLLCSPWSYTTYRGS